MPLPGLWEWKVAVFPTDLGKGVDRDAGQFRERLDQMMRRLG
jgi:hypothetical protein